MSSLKNISEITTIILDVDGVLTDGRFGYHDNGDEIKFFHVRDGSVIKMAMRAGLRVGILSGRKSKANETRAAELGMSFIKQACKNKADGLRELLKEQNLRPEECFYMGDDFIDIPPIRLCGMALSGAVGDSRSLMRYFVYIALFPTAQIAAFSAMLQVFMDHICPVAAELPIVAVADIRA